MNEALESIPHEIPLGRVTELNRMPAHWMLAQMGKKVLRPGGIELTRQMLAEMAITSSDDVVEFAPGLGVTAHMVLERNPASYVAVERDHEAARRIEGILSGPRQRCIVGTAQSTGLPSSSAKVVYGEAMLTMQPQGAKEQIVSEAARLLQPGGRYGIHELALVPADLHAQLKAEMSEAFARTIHHLVQPLTESGWRELLQRHGMEVQTVRTAPMHLLEPRRVIRDEGLFGALRFMFNVLRNREARSRVLRLRRLFREYRDNVGAIMLVAVKK